MQSLTKNTIGQFFFLNPVSVYTLHTSQPIKAATSPSAAKTHAHLLKSGNVSDTWNKVLTAYARPSGVVDADKVFDEISRRDTDSWNSLIAGYVGNGRYGEAWHILKTMPGRGLEFDQYTLGSILKSVASSRRLDLGCQLHAVVVKSGIDRNEFGGSALVDMYAKCDTIKDAYLVFALMPERNTVSWNTMITGHSQVGELETSFRLFGLMERERRRPDKAAASILMLVNETSSCKLMTQLHAKILKYGGVMDSIVYNAVITAYSQSGSIDDSRKVFEEMVGIRDLVTWNSLLAAYALHGLTEHAIKLFVRMQDLRTDQDMYIFTSMISACFKHGQDAQGKILHGLVVKKGLDCAMHVSNALIAMYIRCCDNYSMENAVHGSKSRSRPAPRRISLGDSDRTRTICAKRYIER